MKRLNILIITFAFILSANCQTFNRSNMDLKIVMDFIESINRANIDSLYELMSIDHEFIDSRGNSMIGRDNMKKAWIGYFNLFPDYRIEITDSLQNDSILVLLGYASGTYKNGDQCTHWKIPASWKAKVVDKKVKLWQVYADNSVVLEIINKSK